MSGTTVPPQVDAWQKTWTYRAASFALCVQHVMVGTCAAMWFVAPSSSIEASLDPAWSGAWSALFLAFSLVGLVSRFAGSAKVEATSNIVVAIAVWLWAMTVIVVTLAGDRGGLQTGFMLLAYAASLWGWSLIQIAWTQRTESEAERLKRQVASILALERLKLDHHREDDQR